MNHELLNFATYLMKLETKITVFEIAGALGNHFEVVCSLIQCKGWVAAGVVQFERQLLPSLLVVFWQWWNKARFHSCISF